MNLVDRVIGRQLLNRLSVTDRIYGDSGLAFGNMEAALDDEWDPHCAGGGYAAKKISDNICPKKVLYVKNCLFTKL